MRRIRRVTEAALAAVFFCGCVSVEEHEAVRKQLVVEQARVSEQEKQIRGLKQAVAKQRRDLRGLRLERDELKGRLAEKKEFVPALAAVAEEAWKPEPVAAGGIGFSLGSYKLTEKNVEELKQIARKVADRGYSGILLEGHADPTPISEKSSLESNVQLSALRATAVYHVLVEMAGIDARRVRVVGWGEFKPRPGREKSERRVEIRFVPAKKKQ